MTRSRRFAVLSGLLLLLFEYLTTPARAVNLVRIMSFNRRDFLRTTGASSTACLARCEVAQFRFLCGHENPNRQRRGQANRPIRGRSSQKASSAGTEQMGNEYALPS